MLWIPMSSTIPSRVGGRLLQGRCLPPSPFLRSTMSTALGQRSTDQGDDHNIGWGVAVESHQPAGLLPRILERGPEGDTESDPSALPHSPHTTPFRRSPSAHPPIPYSVVETSPTLPREGGEGALQWSDRTTTHRRLAGAVQQSRTETHVYIQTAPIVAAYLARLRVQTRPSRPDPDEVSAKYRLPGPVPGSCARKHHPSSP